MVDLGHGIACCCHSSSLLRKKSGRVLVLPVELDNYVPFRDIDILWIMWMLTSECVRDDARCNFCCPYLCWELILNDLNHEIIDCPGILTALLEADEQYMTCCCEEQQCECEYRVGGKELRIIYTSIISEPGLQVLWTWYERNEPNIQ